MLKSSFCDYSDGYILVKRDIAITGEGDNADARQLDERNEGVILKSCAPFINCISEINNTQVGIASGSFSLAFSLSTGLVKKLLKTTGNKKKA